MSVYLSNDEFYLDLNKVYIDVSFITPGYREGKYVHLLYDKCEIYGRVHSTIENEIIQLSRTVGGISLDDLNFIRVPILINDFGSSECEYKIHVYFNTMHEPIAKAFAEKLRKKLPKKIASFKVAEVSTLDGVKIYFENDEWLLVRPSGTEPLVRVYAETATKKDTQALLDFGEKLVAQYIK